MNSYYTIFMSLKKAYVEQAREGEKWRYSIANEVLREVTAS
jgi:hypothetical protein